MKPIISPLKAGDRGADVANLQNALLLLIDKGIIELSAAERQFFTDLLSQEQQDQAYKDGTQRVVIFFQEQHQQQPSGEVDAPTADALNRILKELGALDTAGDGRKRVVAGQVLQDDGAPFKGAVILFHESDQGSIRLGEDATDPEGRYTIGYDPALGLDGAKLRVAAFDPEDRLRADATIEAARPVEVVNLTVPREAPPYRVEGRVASRSRAGVGGLRVQIVDKNVGADAQLAEVSTADDGSYSAAFRYPGPKQEPDLQARVLSGEKSVGASDVRYNASSAETLDVVLPDGADASLASEHETLTGGLSAYFHGNLRDLEETDEQQGITYLANKTGWDARAVALAALADQFSARTMDANGVPAIPQASFYALFRAGLPANEDVLYHTDAKTLEEVWKKAAEQGVIPKASADQISNLIGRFQALSAQKLLTGPALVGPSSLKEMLTASRLDDAQQARFAQLYAANRADMPTFWQAVGDAFGQDMANRLQVDGKLDFLTINNAPLMQKVHATAGADGLSDPLELAQMGYHRAEPWSQLLTADVPVPAEIPGDTPEAQQANYADYLAAHVRLSYPTAAVAQMVGSGDLALDVPDQVHAFLTEHQGRFEIGVQPVQQYIAQNNLQVADETVQQVKRLQRVYQITPSDQALTGLMKRGIDAAYHVVHHDKDTFVQSFAADLGGVDSAALTYDKAVQIQNAVLNIAISYLSAKNGIALGTQPLKAAQQAADGAGQILQPAPQGPLAENAADVIAYPTLEGLFGSMDYCACDHCRSILSPAAYLVDLLLSIDRAPTETAKENPQTVLLERRPDIQHLPLTCENTNTPLPYIDLVNETMEYFVTNNLKLDNYTGHSTDGDATPVELLASPQFVTDKAYETLAGKPAQPGDPPPLLPPTPPLPFHLPLENLRRYFDRFEAPLPEVMEALRENDNLERPDPADPVAYGWRDILMEELRLSRAEYALLTDRALTLQELYGYSPPTPEADILVDLSNAKTFTRRLGISYEDILEILKTRFVNPNSTLLPRLERLGVSLATLKALKDGLISDEEFDAALAPHLDASYYGGDIKAWVKDEANYANIMSLITLANPSDSDDLCSVDKLEFRYADPAKIEQEIRAFEFVRLIRFIRLWKKLGWTIEQTDKAITALYPADQTPNDTDDAVNLQRLDDGFLTLLPRLGVIKRVMHALQLQPEKDLLPLLACFAPMDTHGAASLYRQMFLSPAQLKQDGAFADDGFGNFLTDNTQRLMAHAETLRAAFLLTDDEFVQITAALGYDANTPLDLDNVSAIFRRGWLARKMKLSIHEWLLMTRFANIDPFAAPDPVDPPIVRLIELVNRLRAASLKPAQALYLLWNQDISGKSSPDDGQISDFARSLRSDLAAIESEFALADDPDGQAARAKMALVYGNEATDLFFGLLSNSVVTDVEYTHDQGTLEQDILDVAPGSIAYDDFRKRLSYSAGVMPDATRDALKNVAGVTEAFKNAVDELHQKTRIFFDRYPELLPLYDIYVASDDPVEKKRLDLLANFLPELERRRKRQHALQAISAAVEADIGFASAVLDAAPVLHAAGDDARPALDDLTSIETPGLSARFFFRDTATGAVDRTGDAEADLAYAASGSNKLPANPAPASAISGIWSGYLEAPENGFYNIHIEADSGATVALFLSGASVDLVQDGNTWRNSAPIELRAGTLYAISLKVEKVKDNLLVRWETTGRGREIIPARYLYSATLADHLRHVYVRFLKTASLAAALKLTATETAYLASYADYQIDGQGWLNSVPVTGSPNPATSIALLKAFTALLDFARAKADLAPDDERLLAVLKDPVAATENADSLLFTVTRWESSSLDALLIRFGKVNGGNPERAALKDLNTLGRVYDAHTWVKKLGVPASALIKAATNEPNAITVRDLQSALRARYDENDWLNVLKPINDEMRALQRDALVAYILHQMRSNADPAHIDTPEKLFEYFLMDVQMDPCMQTSRVRHALSSVQLFIERCLMNLEPAVAPSSINAKQWEWMKRYRVWEANRQVFLYPENWLEPELRDDQSPFFKETMSELLQSDITEDSAASALLNYLSKLEEVAKLEPCGIYYVENESETSDDIVHVVARTAGASRKYFYRRREYGYWRPWEQIRLDIEDNPVIPVVWKGRLLLFWLKVLKQAPLNPQTMTTSKNTSHLAETSLAEIQTDAMAIARDNTKVTVQPVLCWSEYYNGKWQPAKTSDVNRPADLGQHDSAGFDRSALRLLVSEADNSLRVNISGQGRASFTLYNTHSLPIPDTLIILPVGPQRSMGTFSGDFTIVYSEGFLVFNPNGGSFGQPLTRPVLKNELEGRAIQPNHTLQDTWDAPFFYEDSRHVFMVSTSERIVMVREFGGFGYEVSPLQQKFNIPPLVQRPVVVMPDKIGPITTGRDAGVVDPAPIERFVSEDAYINKGIGTTGTVRYGDIEFGPAGALLNGQMRQE